MSKSPPQYSPSSPNRSSSNFVPPQVPPSSSLLSLPPYSTTSPSRLQSLYSDFSRQKQSNPTSYHSNIEWWRRAIECVVSHGLQQGREGDRLVLNAGRGLIERVRVDGVGKPLGLGAVVTELRRTKSFILLAEFTSARESVYDPGWLPARVAAYVVGKPLWWALEQLGVVGEDGLVGGGSRSDADKGWWGEYVVLALVEKAADEVVARQRGKVGGPGDCLYGVEEFRREFAGVLGADGEVMSERDASVLLKFLERDKRVVVVDKEVIKFIDKDATAEDREITAVDRGILELKNAVENMHAQVDGIQHKIDESTQKATAALRQKRKPIALSYLRSRKQLEDLLTKRLGSLEVLEATLIRVEAAAGDVEIMRSYESSTVTLRAILAHPSLQRDKIDETMEAMAEATADAKDVDDAIRIGGNISVGVDDGDLDEELKALVKEVEGDEEREKARKLEGVGMRVPSGTPEEMGEEGQTREQSIPRPVPAAS